MTHDPTRPGVEERYAQAVDSSDLALLAGRCPADYLIAAGWTGDTLGAALFRLRAEWDTTKAELRQAEVNATDGNRRADTLARHAAAARAKGESSADHDKGQQMLADSMATSINAARLRQQTEDAALTARAMVLMHLKTLAGTRQALHAFAIAYGTREKFYSLPAIRSITGRALQLWLDPSCPHCDGRGFTGGFTEPMRWCQECLHTGKRINGRPGFRLGKTEEHHQFGRALLVEMDRKTDRVAASMRRFLHTQFVAGAKLGPAAGQALQDRLRALRSTEAEKD